MTLRALSISPSFLEIMTNYDMRALSISPYAAGTSQAGAHVALTW